eukprot:TRINITY_DN1783_c0_g1_i1.p1 TRINITY_DN1783_c0_g1~~TRINITY_DN1783_c0_g1_i1.p1  ORF type:complete len:683 (+),score=213.97 TRINITY_DN1783_c0_g1_i1:80-2050(+)
MGKKVGDYALHETLGTGAYSKVKRAVHGTTKREVAIKILDAKKYRPKDRNEWIKREVAVMKKLDHPHIVKLYEVLQLGDKLHLVLELVKGCELLEVIAKTRKLLESEARHYFHQMMDAVSYMHSLGIVHRDLKPENLLVTGSRVLKIADFGLSNFVPTDSSAGSFQLLTTIVGSPDYCAPEVAQEMRYDGFKADVYSCGTILYTMVTGTRPFEAKDAEATLKKVKEGFFIIPRHLSRDCDRLISGMMEMDPQARLSVKGIMSHAWFLEGWDTSKVKKPVNPNLRSELTFEEIEGSIQLIEMHKVSGNAFSLIAGLQEGGVDALVGKAQDVKLLLTVADTTMHDVFCRIVALLKNMSCKVQERRHAPGSGPGRLRLFSYLNVCSGLLTFTTELQAVPPQLVAVTLRLERGEATPFAAMCKAITYNLCDLLRSFEWQVLSTHQAAESPSQDPSPFSPSLSKAISNVFSGSSSPVGSPTFSSTQNQPGFNESSNLDSSGANGSTAQSSAFPSSPRDRVAHADPNELEGASSPQSLPDTSFKLVVTDTNGATMSGRPAPQAITGDADEAIVERAARHVYDVLLELDTHPLLMRYSQAKGSLPRRHRISGYLTPRDNAGLLTYAVDFAAERECKKVVAIFKMHTGPQKVFDEFRSALAAYY